MQLYNTLSKSLEEFIPISGGNVGMYSCGITAYDYAHIGHGRKYVNDDVLKRTLTFLGYKVTHVQNVTDVGHLVSDADEGEDKLEKGAAKFGKTVWEVAEFFTENFYQSMDALNILRPTIICKATEHIAEQIDLVRALIEKGYAYETPEAIYFDVTKFPDYGKLLGQSVSEKKVAVRGEVQTGEHKKHPADFSLWFKTVGRFANHSMHWESPWGDGFPGWHIECSAMSMKYLGEQFDIHTGGEDHIPVHHPNEIAQSEAATGKHPFVKYWMHTSFLVVDGTKMSKSLGNFYTVEDVEKKGFHPLSLRYLYLTTHYRKQLNFTWDALTAAQTSLMKLYEIMHEVTIEHESERTVLSDEKLAKIDQYNTSFREAIENDLNMPQALAVLWEVAKSNIPSPDKRDLFLQFDEVLGLGLKTLPQKDEIPSHVTELASKRKELRDAKEFDAADLVRKQIESAGYIVKDTSDGFILRKA